MVGEFSGVYIYERCILDASRLDSSNPFFLNQEIIEELFFFSFFMATTWSFFSLFFDHLVFFFFLSFFLPPQKSLFIFKTGQGQLSIPTLE